MSRSRLKCPLLVVECFELTSSLARPVIFFQCGISDFTAHIDGNGALLTESYQHWLISGARAMGKILCREHWDVRGAVHGPPFLFCMKQNRDSSEESSEYGGGRQRVTEVRKRISGSYILLFIMFEARKYLAAIVKSC